MPLQDCRLLGISEDRKKNVCQKTNSSSSSKYKGSSTFIKRCLGSASSSNHPIAFFKDLWLRYVLHKFPVLWHTVQWHLYKRKMFPAPLCNVFAVLLLSGGHPCQAEGSVTHGWYLIQANCILSLCRLHLVWDNQLSQGTLSHWRSNSLGTRLVEIVRPSK